MKKTLSITAIELEGLRAPWAYAGDIESIVVMEKVATSTRPVGVLLDGRPCYLVQQRLESGDLRALCFGPDGELVGQYQTGHQAAMTNWVGKNVTKP